MNPAQPVAQSAEFVPTSGGSNRFRLVSEPAHRAARGTVVFVHAFAEEMNKSRRMAARMARLMAGDGWRVVQRDLCGCGDSAGDFGDATWSDWLDDVEDELSQAATDKPILLWCERAGTLLTARVLDRHPDINLLLWQPVISGAQHLQQFLRLHTGARIVESAKSTDGLTPMQRLRGGEMVEVAGYLLRPALASGMEQATFDLPASYSGHVLWLEVSQHEIPQLSSLASRTIERWRARGIAVQAEAVEGPPFWQTQEIEDCPPLLERTRVLLAAFGARSGSAAGDHASDRIPAQDIT
jgi:uncharacterized protein